MFQSLENSIGKLSRSYIKSVPFSYKNVIIFRLIFQVDTENELLHRRCVRLNRNPVVPARCGSWICRVESAFHGEAHRLRVAIGILSVVPGQGAVAAHRWIAGSIDSSQG